MRKITFAKIERLAIAAEVTPANIRKWRFRGAIPYRWQVEFSVSLKTTPAAIAAAVHND